MEAEVRLYDSLFAEPLPGADGGALWDDLNPASRTVLTAAAGSSRASRPRRRGRRCSSSARAISAPIRSPPPDAPVFNRTVGLRDSWARAQKRAKRQGWVVRTCFTESVA